jgi:hypothetical protein
MGRESDRGVRNHRDHGRPLRSSSANELDAWPSLVLRALSLTLATNRSWPESTFIFVLAT